MEWQWFIAWSCLMAAIGYLLAYYFKKRELMKGVYLLNDVLNAVRGEKHSLVDNMRFLLDHLREGGPEELKKLFKFSGLAEDVDDYVAQAMELLDDYVVDGKLGNLK